MKPINRRRLYDTGIAVLAVLAMWGVITAEDLDQLTEILEQLDAIAPEAAQLGGAILLYLARKYVPLDDAAGPGGNGEPRSKEPDDPTQPF